jgi:hypothetical protein
MADERFQASFCPHWVVNDTGLPLQVWPLASPEARGTREGAIFLDDGAACKLHVGDKAQLRQVRLAAPARNHSPRPPHRTC